jgi:hypothetical protein
MRPEDCHNSADAYEAYLQERIRLNRLTSARESMLLIAPQRKLVDTWWGRYNYLKSQEAME